MRLHKEKEGGYFEANLMKNIKEKFIQFFSLFHVLNNIISILKKILDM